MGGEEFIARLWATRKIGYLLQQIRLHGEERELVDEIVDLSIRYGIITPYTSFLVEETERALREEGRAQIVEEAEVGVRPRCQAKRPWTAVCRKRRDPRRQRQRWRRP